MILGSVSDKEVSDSLEDGMKTGIVDGGTETQIIDDAGWETYWGKEEDSNIIFKYALHTVRLYNETQ